MKYHTLIPKITSPKTMAGRLTTAYATKLMPLLLLLAPPAVVQAQFNYTTNNGAITITGYTGSGGSVTIPSTLSGLPVTSIGDFAFQRCTSLTNVTIGNSVTSIGVEAFWNCTSLTAITIPNSVSSIGMLTFENCTNLTNVTIGNSVTSIGYQAFSVCTSLTNVTIGNGVTNIGDQAFYACGSLTAITVDALNPAYSSLDGVLFDKSQTTLVQFPAGGAETSYMIPNSVTSIGDFAFSYCSNLTSVTIPNSVTNIGDHAFYSCSLSSVTIPDSVTSIGGYAFDGCASLTSVTIPNSVNNIGSWAFANCTNLTSLCFQGSAPSIGGDLVDYVNATVYYVAGTTGWDAFSNDTGLTTSLWDPESQMAYAVTNGTVTITGYTGPGGSLIIPDTINGLPVTTIGGYLDRFSGDYWGAFYGCTTLTNVTIGNSVTNIGVEAFWNCTSLTAITIGSGVTRTGNCAFWNCTSLTSITIPNSVTNIGMLTFENCTNLTHITIGSGVTSIGSWAFYLCSRLTSVCFQGNAPSADLSVFEDNNNATIYYLPGTRGWGSSLNGRPTVLWNPRVLTTDSTFGVRTDQFGFTVRGTSGLAVAVDACANLANPTWIPLATKTLTHGSAYFSDPQWTNYPARFYRLRWP